MGNRGLGEKRGQREAKREEEGSMEGVRKW